MKSRDSGRPLQASMHATVESESQRCELERCVTYSCFFAGVRSAHIYPMGRSALITPWFPSSQVCNSKLEWEAKVQWSIKGQSASENNSHANSVETALKLPLTVKSPTPRPAGQIWAGCQSGPACYVHGTSSQHQLQPCRAPTWLRPAAWIRSPYCSALVRPYWWLTVG